MYKFCVIGNPIGHSLSPQLFQYIAKSEQLNLDYQRLCCSETDLARSIEQLTQLEYLGANITLPFKEKIIDLLDEVDEDAKKLGAVNVLKWSNGKIKGFNTDIIGITFTLKKNKIKMKGKTALIFGAGGAARSACYAFAQLGCHEIFIQNRTISKAKKIIKEFSFLFPHISFKLKRKENHHFDLVLNATPLGLKTHPYKKLLLKTTANVAFDLLYSAKETPFLKEAKLQKMQLLTGMDMFVAQALASLEIWAKKMTVKKKEELHLKVIKYLKRTMK